MPPLASESPAKKAEASAAENKARLLQRRAIGSAAAVAKSSKEVKKDSKGIRKFSDYFRYMLLSWRAPFG
jgi:hypothetical protein